MEGLGGDGPDGVERACPRCRTARPGCCVNSWAGPGSAPGGLSLYPVHRADSTAFSADEAMVGFMFQSSRQL
jgi:threonine dehydrogenase-like Zn-dependent dehydrogenase